MVNDKKNIPDSENVDEPHKPGKLSLSKLSFGEEPASPDQGGGSCDRGCIQVVTPPVVEKSIEVKQGLVGSV